MRNSGKRRISIPTIGRKRRAERRTVGSDVALAEEPDVPLAPSAADVRDQRRRALRHALHDYAADNTDDAMQAALAEAQAHASAPETNPPHVRIVASARAASTPSTSMPTLGRSISAPGAPGARHRVLSPRTVQQEWDAAAALDSQIEAQLRSAMSAGPVETYG